MNNIFNTADNSTLLERINSLSADARPLWGKMNASQMLAHCQKPLQVAEGSVFIKRGVLGLLFGKMAKRDFLKAGGLKKNLPTDPSFKITGTPEFSDEQQLLAALVSKFGMTGPSVITNTKHPFFGDMTEEEWGILHYKHLDHHLRQFGK